MLAFLVILGLFSICRCQISSGPEVVIDKFSNIPVFKVESRSLVTINKIYFLNDTAVSFSWTLNITTDNTFINGIEVEIGLGFHTEDFIQCEFVNIDKPYFFSNSTFYGTHTVSNLLPNTKYSVRLVPSFPTGRRLASAPVSFQTLNNAVNYWEPVYSRRLSKSSNGRGFAYPVLQRPHLDTGVEVLASETSDNPLRFSDSPTLETPLLPSGRRGHTLTQVDDKVLMFGGRTNGYSCASIYKDTVDLGNANSGLTTYPCTHKQSEVNELWSLDIATYTWTFLNVSKWQSTALPPSREQHIAAMVHEDLYVFGGKSRIFSSMEEGALVFHADTVYGDLWRLSIQHANPYTLIWRGEIAYGNDLNTVTSAASMLSATTGATIPQDRRLFAKITAGANDTLEELSDGVDARTGLCIEKIAVRVTVTHPCINQLRISLLGPGPQTGSPNFFTSSSTNEVLLFDRVMTNGTGCVGGIHSFLFDDDANRLPETCCTQTFSGPYQPEGKLAVFMGASMTADWTLVVQDSKNDAIEGALIAYQLDFMAAPCVPTYTWTNLSAISGSSANAPPPRYQAHALAHQNYLFIYGGRDACDREQSDLYRFNIDTNTWSTLTPVDFDLAFAPSSSEGASFLLTTWGMLRFGGYYRQPTMPLSYGNYDNSVMVLDPVTMRWRAVELQPWPLLGQTTVFDRGSPAPRYFSAATFLPSKQFKWRTSYTHRNIYDRRISSTHANYAGAIMDAVMLYGGFDGSTGSILDGSSGGYFKDLWMLRLGNWSTDGARAAQEAYVATRCAWRANPSAINAGTQSCLESGNSSPCILRDLLMLAWCSANNQTIT